MANKRSASKDGKSGGNSRAAKKRAMKKKKQHLKTQNALTTITSSTATEEQKIKQSEVDCKVCSDLNHHENGEKKLQIPFGEEEDNDGIEGIDTIQKDKQKKKKKKSVTENRDGNLKAEEQHDDFVNNDGDDDDKILYNFLSCLTPAEILFPEKFMSESVNSSEEKEVELEQPDPLALVGNIPTEKRAHVLFSSLLMPGGLSTDSFYKHYWEKKPLLISMSENIAEPDSKGTIYGEDLDLDNDTQQVYRHRFDGFISKEGIEKMTSQFPVKYGQDINVTNYCNTGVGEKRRITLDQLPDMSDNNEEDVEFVDAESNDLWSNFKSGCTLRLLCPQKHNDEVHCLLSNLEHEFGCMVGSNVYLTPGGATNQGFAPHYDDIEAFILQVEGYKHWRVYAPMNKEETLPRESSRDFTDEEMKDIEPVIDVELGPGDLLYMPRGWIHQANTCKSNHHSLHLTVSAMQNWSWADFLGMIMPEALEAASASSVTLRAGLPRKFLSYMGTMHDADDSGSDILKKIGEKGDEGEEENANDKELRWKKKLQDTFKAEAKKKILRVCKEALSMVTSGCDQMGTSFLSDRLPPALTAMEAAFTSENRAETGGKIFPNTMVRLAKPGLARLVVEDDKAVIYHSLDNSRVYHETPISPLQFEIDDAPALEMLLTTVEPHWICVQDLIHGDIEDKMDIAQSLYNEGILAMFQDDRPDRSIQTG